MYQAVVFEAPPGSEVVGALLLPYFENLESHQIKPLLKQYGLEKENIKPEEWYPFQILLDITKTISETGVGALDIAIGKAYTPLLIEQYHVTSIEQFFEVTINEVVRAGVRNMPEGYGYKIEKLGHLHYRISSNIPSANGVSYGNFWEACRLLRKDEEDFSVKILRGLDDDDYLLPGIFEIKIG